MTIKFIHARIGLCLLLGLLAWTAAFPSAHAAEPKRLGVLTFRGPGEGITRNVVTQAGKTNHFLVVGGQQISKTASKLGVTLDTNDSFRAIAKDLGIAAFVTGEVTTKKATLSVRSGADGAVSAEATWSGPNPKKLAALVQKTFWRRLGSAIERAKPPSGSKQAAVAEEAPAPETGADTAGKDDSEDSGKSAGKGEGKKRVAEASEESAASPPAESEGRKKRATKKKSHDDAESDDETTVSARAEPEDEDRGEGLEALDVALGGRVMTRTLSYVQDYNNPNAAPNSRYSLPVAPQLALGADFYPAALFMGGFAANLGLTADFSYLLPVVATASPNGMGTYATYSLAWSLGAKVRLPYGLYGTVAYGDQRYQLTPSGGAAGVTVPMTDYKFVRAGGGIRYKATSKLAVMGNAAYLRCLSLGSIGGPGYFPKGTAAALEIGAAVGYRLTPTLEVRVGVDVRRYGLAFHVTPDALAANPNLRVAGGAVDQYIAAWAALAVQMGGNSGGGGGGKAHHGEDEESDLDGAKSSKEKDQEDEADEDVKAREKKTRKKKRKTDEDE